MELAHVFNQMLIFFVIAAVGFACAKLGYIGKETQNSFGKLLLNVTLPCMIVASVEGVNPTELGNQSLLVFALGVAQYFMLLAAGFVFNVLFRTKKAQRPMYLFMSVCTNTGFIGLPVAVAVFGANVAVLCSIFVVALSLPFYCLALSLLTEDNSQSLGARLVHGMRMAINPPFVSALAALALAFSGIALPEAVMGSAQMIGNVTAPLAMMLVGSIVSEMNLREALREWRMYPFIAIRQIIAPLGAYALLSPFVGDAVVLGIFVIMFAMPTGSLASTFALEYGADHKLAAQGTVLSTIASFPIVPLLAAFIS